MKTNIERLIQGLTPSALAVNAEKKHNDFRLMYRSKTNTVDTFYEFEDAIGNYFKAHFTACVSIGGDIPLNDAKAKAKQIINHVYERKFNGNISSAFKDASLGTNGGLRSMFDFIAEHLTNEGRQLYINQLFDRVVEPTQWKEKVEIIRQFFEQYGRSLGNDIDINNPERYAHKFDDIILAFNNAISQTSGLFNSV